MVRFTDEVTLAGGEAPRERVDVADIPLRVPVGVNVPDDEIVPVNELVRVDERDWDAELDAEPVDVGVLVAGVELCVADEDGVGGSAHTRLQPTPMQLRQLP